MLLAVAVVPETALLVPGVAGRSDVLGDVRAAALDAVRTVLAAAPDRVVVVAPGSVPAERRAPVRATLAPAGVPDTALAWPLPETPAGSDVAGVAASVALLLLAQAGARVPVDVVEVAPAQGSAALRELGARLVADGTVGLVVAGSLSARHGPDAALADDDRAPAVDAGLADLLARAADAPGARADLRDADAALAAELAVSAWAPWQVLLGAAGDRVFAARTVLAATDLGVHRLVATWTAADRTHEGAA